jgi:hypothetical protein
MQRGWVSTLAASVNRAADRVAGSPIAAKLSTLALPIRSMGWIPTSCRGSRRLTDRSRFLPYPVVTVDMGQNLARMKSPTEIEKLWLDYMLELAEEARGDPAREATTVVIGIHPFVVGTPDGAAAMRRVLIRLKSDRSVWLTDTEAIFKAISQK